ncbi:restriction endonuclease subunit S [Mitsuokella sp. WILCCON 0060]|uniref:restriction endonuclease subunit S n=1 Tax=Mitsuokella sp. WILCCON 0060 TaxID=3345341 RepID=UPI003F1CD387
MKVRLGDYIKEYSVRNKSNKDIPVYSVTNNQGFCRDYFGKEVASKDKSTYKIVPRGCFAYNPSRINVGSVDWQKDQDEVIVSPLYNVFSVSEKLNKQYLYYYLKSDFALQRIKAVATGSVRDNLKLTMLYEFPIEIPSLSIQAEIVKKLDTVIKLKKLRKEEFEKLDYLVKARFIEMFGDPSVNPKGWPLRKLGNLGELNRGVSKHRPRNAPELLGGIYPLIQTGDVANSATYISGYTSTYSELGLKQSRMWPKGTLCITIAANIAKTGILDFDACFPDSVVGFIPDKIVDTLYIHYWFSFFQKILEEQAPQSAQKNINLKILRDLNVMVPPYGLQEQFINFVYQVNKSKFTISKYL